MELLLKKDITGKTSITIEELQKLFNITLQLTPLYNRIKSLEEELTQLKLQPKLNYKDIIEILSNEGIVNLSGPINLGCSSSIEKIETVPNGVFYYDAVNEKLRFKVKNNWETIK